ncbi:TPA: ead/Ea22-like family protein [Citrobacter koseri]|nr:ead/Ea22-like family protein [Citrobacter koseri]
MTDKQALRDIAESIEREEWELLDNGDDEYQVIVKGSLEKGETYRSYQPVSNEISERKIAAFIAAFGPATVLALLDELEALQSFRTAYMEWSDKTDWVQTDKRLDVIKPWGKHRADVMKLYIDHLESNLEAAEHTAAVDHTRTIKTLNRRIAELRDWNAGLAQESFTHQQRIAELEAREVKIPCLPADCDRTEAHFKYQEAIREAGIEIAAGIGKGE